MREEHSSGRGGRKKRGSRAPGALRDASHERDCPENSKAKKKKNDKGDQASQT